jgi:phosphate transport system substrate-binding protein
MKLNLWKIKTLVTLFALAIGVSGANAQLKGAGSTFAASLYGGWSQTATKGADARMEYLPVGSSAGVKAAQDRSADFGASDRALTRAELDSAGLVQFPTAIGGVVMMTNIPGITSDKVKLDGDTLAGIYLGRIKQWNDPAIKALNADLSLPALVIVPVFRNEGSGTSNVFTTYLSKISAPFKAAIGTTSNLKVASGKGGKTSADVVKLVRDTAGGIGYLDYSFAIDLGLPTVQMKNQWGKFITATPESIQLAMRSMDWERLLIDQDPTFEMDMTDAACPGCWPITSATFVLVPIKTRAENSARVLEFFEHAIKAGDEVATKEGYVPLPPRAKNLVSLAMRRWQSSLIQSGASKPTRKANRDEQNLAVALAKL